MTVEQEDAKSRLRRVLGEQGLAQLEQACVLVVGLGGVGSSCAEALARGGIGSFVLIDGDEVQLSNINRQAIAFQSTVGQRTVVVMGAMIRDINPEANLVLEDRFLLPEETAGVLDTLPRPDYVIDAIDTVGTKIALASWAQDQGIPDVSSMGGANKMDPTQLRFGDIYETAGDPLSRAVRKRARAAGLPSMTVLYSGEPSIKVEVAEGIPRSERAELGTMSYFPPIMGQMLAGYVIRALLDGAGD